MSYNRFDQDPTVREEPWTMVMVSELVLCALVCLSFVGGACFGLIVLRRLVLWCGGWVS